MYRNKWMRALGFKEPVFDSKGNLISVVELAHNITELKRLENEKKNTMKELQKALSEVKKLNGFIDLFVFWFVVRMLVV